MSKEFLTIEQVFIKVGKLYAGNTPDYFINKSRIIQEGGDPEKLSSYSDQEYPVDDDIVPLNYDVWDGTIASTYYTNGNGTLSDPYVITSCSQLAKLAEVCNSSSIYRFTNKYFRLDKNLNLNSSPWTAIGNVDGDNYRGFDGNFNGNGHVIKGIYLVNQARAGLFGMKYTGVIENLGVEIEVVINDSLNNDYNFGAIVARIMGNGGNPIIRNCYSRVKFAEISYCVGGIIGSKGYNQDIYVSDCYSVINCASASLVGGIIGAFQGRGSFNCSNCYSVINEAIILPGSNTGLGGMVGKYTSGGSANVFNCYYDNSVVTYLAGGGTLTTGSTSRDEMYRLATGLGGAFRQDVNNVNEGFPVLGWQ